MSYDKSAISNCCRVGRFPSLKIRSDERSRVKCCESVRCVTCCGREAVVLQDDCKYSGACGKQVFGCFKPVCPHKPCGNLTSCHDQVLKTVIQDECRRPCGNEVSVSFPVHKWKGVSCRPDCDQLS